MEFLLSLLHNQSLEQENRKLNLSQVGRKRKNKEQATKIVWSYQRAKRKCQTVGLRPRRDYNPVKGVPTALGELEVGGMENFQMMANNFQAGLR